MSCYSLLVFAAYLFLSTLSLRRATVIVYRIVSHPHGADFYPRSPCGERRGSSSKSTRCLRISIHALLAESDRNAMGHSRSRAGSISIHALLAESDLHTADRAELGRALFLSTLSLRRATRLGLHEPDLSLIISIHALLAESDGSGPAWLASCFNFYPRSPCGERQAGKHAQQPTQPISIHALLAESDY